MKSARNKAVIISCILLSALFVIVTKFKVSTDLGLFLPEPSGKFEQLLRYQIDHGASSNVVFLAFSGMPTKELAKFNKDITELFRNSGTFSNVTNNASSLSERALEFLVRNRYLLTHRDLKDQFSVEGLRSALKDRLQGLASSESHIEKRYLRADPTGEVIGLLGEWQGKISRHKRPQERDGVWFSDDLSRTLVILEISADISEMQNQIIAVMEIRDTFENLKIPGLNMIMTGPAVFAVESGEDIRADVKNLSFLAMFIVIAFLLAVYRSMRMIGLVVFPLLMGILAATATILLLSHQIHGITLAFGITLAGVAIDYPIHLLTGMGKNPRKNQAKLKKIWRTLRLGVFSTVIAYAAFLNSGFDGLRQLGIFTIVGLVTAALSARWILPYLAIRSRDLKPGLVGLHQFLESMGKKASGLRVIVIGFLIVSLIALTFTEKTILHLNVDSLSPINADRRAEGKLLRSDLGFWYGGSMMLMTAEDKEGVLQLSESLQPYLDELITNQVIESYDMAAHFLPSLQKQEANKMRVDNAENVRGNLEQALVGTPFRENVFEPFVQDISNLDSLELVHPSALEETAIGKKLNSLLFDFNNEASGVILLHGVKDSQSLQQFSDKHEGLYYMHLKSASTELVARSVDRVIVTMLGCTVVIYLALMLAFRSFKRPLKIMIPTFAAAVGVAAILVFTGNPLSIFHLISLLLVVGLGLDYALFFNRLPENEDEWDTTFKALWVCGTTTLLVFGILTFSQTPPLQAIGVTVGIGAFISMVFAAMWATTPEQTKKLMTDSS